MDIGGQYNREELADLSSTVKSLIPSPCKTEDKSLVQNFKLLQMFSNSLFIHSVYLFHAPDMPWNTADIFQCNSPFLKTTIAHKYAYNPVI